MLPKSCWIRLSPISNQAAKKSCCDLISSTERGLCACVEEAVGLCQAAVSHHMGVLVRAGLVDAEKRGRWMFYRRSEATLARLADDSGEVPVEGDRRL